MTETVVLAARLDFPVAKSLAEQLKELRGKDIQVSAADVTHLGTNCLQVLISAGQTWTADGKAFAFTDISESFQNQLGQFGLSIDALTQGA
ncbi:MAG: STAS domain-containing protein [Pseudomonadota bacterium]